MARPPLTGTEARATGARRSTRTAALALLLAACGSSDDFIDWASLRNPVLALGDRALKDVYAGSADGDRFERRGHGKIGVARSRDLVEWHVPGDMG